MPTNSSNETAYDPPDGWEFLSSGLRLSLVANGDEGTIVPHEVPAAYAALAEWLELHDMRATPYDPFTFRSPVWCNVWAAFTLYPQGSIQSVPSRNRWLSASDFRAAVVCRFCGDSNPAGSPYCPGCANPGGCSDGCGIGGFGRVPDGHYNVNLCCVHECSGCSNPCSVQWPLCGDCEPHRGFCDRCDQPTSGEACFNSWSGLYHCPDHVPQECVECGAMSSYTDWSDDHDGYVCSECEEYAAERQRNQPPSFENVEEFDDNSDLLTEQLALQNTGRRVIRSCGVEIEGGGDSRRMIRSLYDQGLVRNARLAGYHSSGRELTTREELWNVEADGSVDWELVSPILDLTDPEHVNRMSEVLQVVRQSIREGDTYLDMRCGLHIHVSAERVTPKAAYNLSVLFGYLEDTLFRLGSAKWARHRALVNGSGYCQPINKQSKSVREFGMFMERDDSRYGALSFRNYFSRMLSACTCGAIRYDSWDSCTCNLGKCTFEFRLFNSSVNMQKLHAYLALCQSLVAYAINMDDIVDRDEEFPVDEFIQREFKNMSDDAQTERVVAWGERIEWLLTKLDLTDAERENVLYCVNNSELSAVNDLMEVTA